MGGLLNTKSQLERGIGLYTTTKKFLPDIIYGANDGIITTLAIISGVVGAALPSIVILILGFANLLADGLSMGASNVLSRRSDTAASDLPSLSTAARHGVATFIGFVAAGLIPLSAYVLPWFGDHRFATAGALGLIALFVIGAGRAAFSNRHWLIAGVEMLVIGALAAAAAYGIGAVGAMLVGLPAIR
jgi:VIT1/CCC1 family predicted Fe2+/Mn2+ transporter